MKKRVTLRDVAQAAGVHISTASRALAPNTNHPVTQRLGEHVRRVSEALGYERNAHAFSLRTRRTRMIGVVIPDITDPVYALILRGLENALFPRRYVSIVASLDGNVSREAEVTRLMRSRDVDGLILGSVEREDEVVANLLAQGVPMVTLGRRVNDAGVSSITSDHDHGIGLALQHVAGLGHRKVAHIAGPQSLSTGAGRFQAFVKGSASLGLDFDPDNVVFARSYSVADGRSCAGELLARGAQFTAVICANDRLAVGAMAEFRQRGRACPQHVSITGYNDMPMVELLTPPLTTVRAPLELIGYHAASTLVRLIEEPATEREAAHTVLPVDLMVRASTARANAAY